MGLQVLSHSADETQKLGEQLGNLLKAGDVICLYGELGTGKTVLTKGLAKGLGVASRDTVRSPTFVLIHRYQARVPLYHADLYRLDDPADLEDIGLRELLSGEGVTVIEWADKLKSLLPVERLELVLEHRSDDLRLITIQPHGGRYDAVIEQWQIQEGTTPTLAPRSHETDRIIP